MICMICMSQTATITITTGMDRTGQDRTHHDHKEVLDRGVHGVQPANIRVVQFLQSTACDDTTYDGLGLEWRGGGGEVRGGG